MDVDWLRSSSFIYLSVRRALLLQYQKVNFEWFLYGCYYRNGRHQFLLKTLYFSKRFYCENTIQKILHTHTHTHTLLTLLGTVVILDNILWLLIMQNQVNFFLERCVFPFLVISITAVYDLLCFHRPWDYLMTWCVS